MRQRDDLSRCLIAFEQDATIITVVDLSQSSWVVGGIVPGLERHPVKKLPADENRLLELVRRWEDEAAKAGRVVNRVVVAFEAGRDGFWLARWLRTRGIESHVITRRALRYRASVGEQRRTDLTPNF